jgi:hypothetical protein
MGGRQDLSTFSLQTRWVGGLPLVNAILQRLNVFLLLTQALPAAVFVKVVVGGC